MQLKCEGVRRSFTTLEYIMNGIDFMMSLICIDVPNYLRFRTFNQQERDIIM